MRRILLLLCCLCVSASSLGCLLDEVRQDSRMSRMGVSSKARQIENDLDFDLH